MGVPRPAGALWTLRYRAGVSATGEQRSWRFRLHRAYRRFGPAVSRVVTVEELVDAGRCEWIEVDPAAPFPRPSTRWVGGPAPGLDPLDLLPAEVPAVGVIHMADVRVDGHQGWILTGGGAAIADSSWFGRDLPHRAQVPRQAPLSRHLTGTTVALCTEFAHGNYGHVLYDLIPRLDLLEQSGLRFDQVDTVLCNVGGARRRMIEELGIPMEKVVWTDRLHTYRCDRLIATTFPGVRRGLTERAAQFLRHRLPIEPSRRDRRLYIPRRTSRIVANEHDLLPILERHGFEVFDPTGLSSGRMPRSTFASAVAVVGGHGAGLADIVFSPPGTRLMELLPTDHPEPYYMAAAAAVGADHRYLTTASTSTRAPEDWRARDAAVTVELDAFAQAIDELVDGLP